MATRESIVRVRVDTDASGASSKLSRFGKFAGAAALGVGALAVGGALAAKKIYEIGDASDDANARIEQINKKMGLFGKQTAEVTQRIEKYAEATARQTGIDANSIKATQAKLLTFRNLAKSADDVGGQFDRATQAAIDLAAAGFGTAETNATQLGKALQDPVKGLTALSRAGVTFTDQEKERITTLVESNRMGEAQALVLKAIETQVGGTAKATAGGFERMREVFRQGGDALAKKFLPYMDRFGNFMVDKGLPAIKKFAGELQERFGPALKRIGEFIRERVIPAARQFNEWFVEKIAPGIKRFLTPVIDGARKAFEKIRDKIQENKKPLGDLFDAFKKVAEFVADKILPLWGKQVGKQLEVMGTAIGGAIDVIANMVTFWQKVYNAIQDVIGAVKDVIHWLGEIHVPDIDIPGVRIAARSGAAGAVPLGAAAGGSSTVNHFHFHGFVGNERQVATEIDRVLHRGRVSAGAAAG